MAEISVLCPQCGSDHVKKRGKTNQGKQRYACHNTSCLTYTFILDYSYQGHLPEVKKKIIDTALNGSGIRDIARVLSVSQTTVIKHILRSEHVLNAWQGKPSVFPSSTSCTILSLGFLSSGMSSALPCEKHM